MQRNDHSPTLFKPERKKPKKDQSNEAIMSTLLLRAEDRVAEQVDVVCDLLKSEFEKLKLVNTTRLSAALADFFEAKEDSHDKPKLKHECKKLLAEFAAEQISFNRLLRSVDESIMEEIEVDSDRFFEGLDKLLEKDELEAIFAIGMLESFTKSEFKLALAKVPVVIRSKYMENEVGQCLELRKKTMAHLTESHPAVMQERSVVEAYAVAVEAEEMPELESEMNCVML